MADSGTIDSVKINGIFYETATDTDVTFTFGQYETENQATSGVSNMKVTKRQEDVTGIEIQTSDAKRELLKDFIDSRRDGDLEVTLSTGSNYSASGRVNATGWTSMDNKLSVDLLPRRRWTKTIV